ncbi:MAG: SDR family oxidoreductase [Burkholderiaceae bacterium]
MSNPSAVELPTTPSLRLDGRRALVTGAGRGIGLAAAAALAEAGAHVTLAARSRSEIEAVATALRARGQQAEALQLDVSRPDAVRAALAELEPFRILVNSAGTNRPALAVDVSEADYDAVMAINVKGAFFVAREVARGLISAGLSGSIVQVSSQMGHVGSPRRSVYCASKHAIEGMTKALAWELGPQGVRVNTLCPTFIETAMTRTQLQQPEFRDFVLSKIALGRVGQLADVMGPVLFLASDASAMVTGSALLVDGGWTAS